MRKLDSHASRGVARLGLSLLLLVAVSWPAAAQIPLAQQCAAFGLAQYRTLDPAVDRILVGGVPAPVLERFETKAGTQPVAAALTIRGSVTFRGRSAVETQFVCLLDPADRPLFFYALPVSTTRAAPTPLARGGTAQAPEPSSRLAPLLPPRASPSAPAPPLQSLPAATARMRGVVRDLGGRLQFSPCDGVPLPLEDRTPGQELTRALDELTAGRDGRPLFVEIQGARDTGPDGGIAAMELRRAAVETMGCRERFDQREWVALGGEPAWRLEITGRDMVLIQSGAGTRVRTPHGGVQRDAGRLVYAASQLQTLRVAIEERRCIDPVSGSLFSYYVDVQSEGKSLAGCAAHNPAMPAP
jgi:uncharacterized membrane protein